MSTQPQNLNIINDILSLAQNNYKNNINFLVNIGLLFGQCQKIEGKGASHWNQIRLRLEKMYDELQKPNPFLNTIVENAIQEVTILDEQYRAQC
jgi:hypothetical protein